MDVLFHGSIHFGEIDNYCRREYSYDKLIRKNNDKIIYKHKKYDILKSMFETKQKETSLWDTN